MSFHPPYQAGGGMQLLESEIHLPPRLQKRVDFIVAVEQAVKRNDRARMRKLLAESRRLNRQASTKKLLEALR